MAIQQEIYRPCGYYSNSTITLTKRENTMKKIINGKVYNTDTATLIGQWDNGKYTNDIFYSYGNLYKTKGGQYFLTGDSQFIFEINPSDNVDSHHMWLLDSPDALKWCEYRDIDADIIIAEFNISEAE